MSVSDNLAQRWEQRDSPTFCFDAKRHLTLVGWAPIFSLSFGRWFQWLDRRWPGRAAGPVLRKVGLNQMGQ